MYSKRQNTYLVLIALLMSLGLSAQEVTQEPIARKAPNRAVASDEDSLKVRYFYLSDINENRELTDTLFQDFEKYATVRQFRTGALTLGNLGSSHHKIIYNPREDILTDPGFRQYDNYKLRREDFKFYRLQTAYNDLFFSPQGGQENFMVKAKFSGNFQNDINVSLDFERISQEGFYRDQVTKSTRFGIGLWKANQEKNHDLFFTLIANNHNEDHNGGLQNITDNGGIRDRFGEATRLSEADTRHQHFSYALDNFLSVGPSKKYAGHHRVQIDQGFFRYSDEGTIASSDTLLYTENFITDPRGIRYLMEFTRFTNTLDVAFDSKALGIQLGIKHQYSRFRLDDGLDQINDAFAFAQINAQVGNIAQLKAHGEIGIAENIGNLQLTSVLSLEPIEGLRIRGNLKILRYDPFLIHDKLSVSFTNVYQNDFAKINEFFIGGNIFWNKINTEIEFNSGIIDGPIAYTADALPFQKAGSTEYIQAIVNHRWHFNWIGIENALVYQSFSDNLYNLPEVYGIHNAYVQFPLFKKQLLTRIGGLYYSLRNNTPVSFFPITGAFIPSPNGLINPTYPYYEIYGDFKISQFSLFLKLENANDLFVRNRSFQVVDYPQIDWKLRLGVRWMIRG